MKRDKISVFPGSAYSCPLPFTVFSVSAPPFAWAPKTLARTVASVTHRPNSSREAACRAGPDMAEGRVFVEPRGKARICGGAARWAKQPCEGTAGRGHMEHSGRRELSSPASTGRVGWG